MSSVPLRTASIEVDLSVTPFRRWKKSHFSSCNSNIAANRRFSSGPLPTLSNKSLGEFVRPRKLDMVLKVFPEDMPLLTFCQIDPNTINIEEETLREKVIVALHAARACCVNYFEVRNPQNNIISRCTTRWRPHRLSFHWTACIWWRLGNKWPLFYVHEKGAYFVRIKDSIKV